MYEWREELEKLREKYFTFDVAAGRSNSISGQEALDYEREQARIVLLGIWSDAAQQEPFKSIEEAEAQSWNYGHEYRPEWLKANTQEGNLDNPYIRYYITVEAYSEAPYKSMSKKTLTDLLKIRPDDYLKDLPPDAVDPLTIYRGGGELTEREAFNALSWTTDLDTAVFFYDRRFDDVQLWKAQIYKKDIIAYYDGRGESEIIQYRKARNIEPIELEPDEIIEALERRKKKADLYWKEQEPGEM